MKSRTYSHVLATYAAILTLWAAAPLLAQTGREVEQARFSSTIGALLSAKCVACHRPENRKGGFDLTTREGLLRGGESGAGIVPSKPDESPVYTRSIAADGERPEMPEKGEPLTPQEAVVLREWIAAGALWPENVVLKEKAKADASFWSLQPVANVAPPEVADAPAEWRMNPLDRFIWQKLAEKKLQPNPAADPRTFIRRATYDLLGLPPTAEEVAAFARECRETSLDVAVIKLIDRLLDRPQYGERWGRHWLDVIRFGESRGYERNEIITNLWPFRDYVIRSFNEDKPFDRLVHEHLAGDVIGKDQPEIEIGSAFLVAGPYDDVGNQDAVAAAQIRADQMDEMIRASSEAFLGLSLGCARCHDHKFDPLLQKDYYALYATFAGTVHGPREVATAAARQERAEKLKPLQMERDRIAAEKAEHDKVLAERAKQAGMEVAKIMTPEDAARAKRLQDEIARLDSEIRKVPSLPVWWVGNHRPVNGPQPVFLGGSPQRKGEDVLPASLNVLRPLTSTYQLEAATDEGARRLALAKWITAADNPLTSRVLANRVWQYHFGQGLVDTPSDFGYLGSRPTHPELLDWLAREVQRTGWKLKPLHRLIMTSQTYRQSGQWREEPARADADSRLLWRFPPRRLSGEEIRDTQLQLAGKLDLKMGGPGFRLYEYQQDNVATYVPLDVPGPETYRRSVYHHNARAARVDVLTDFDCPDPAFAEPRRASTTTPLQALTLMNHRFALDMTQLFAERLQRDATDVAKQVKLAFQFAYSREPSEREQQAAEKLVAEHGLNALCRAILNSNELIFVN